MMSSCGISQKDPLVYPEVPMGKVMISANTVYNKIRQLASNSVLWEKLLIKSEKEMFYNGIVSNDHITNCYKNAYLLNVFFVGEQRANEIERLLSFTVSEKISLFGPYASKYLKLHVHFIHFLSGNAVLDLNKGVVSLDNWSCQKSPKYNKCLMLFKRHIVDLYTTGIVSNEIYNFNTHVIEKLQKEIAKNKNEISEHCSCIYHIAIIANYPPKIGASSIEAIQNAPLRVHHVFNLEQYFDYEKNAVGLRMHHSWKNKFTLGEYYEKHSNDQIDERNFFNHLKSMLDFDDSAEFSNIKKHQFSCFNVDQVLVPALIIRPELGVYAGYSIRYATSKVNPQECLKNINEVVKRYGD